jgi:hypothetical protein
MAYYSTGYSTAQLPYSVQPNASTPSGSAYYAPQSSTPVYNNPQNYLSSNPASSLQGTLGASTSSGGSSGQSSSSVPAGGGGNGGSSGGSSTPNYDALMNSINDIANQGLAGLEPQKQAQEAIANNSYGQGVSDLQAQQTEGNAQLATQSRKANENQTKTLYDLNDALRNSFNSGANILGGLGAGDSSAVNQYSYALTQQGNKNRGNVMAQTASIQNDINDRIASLQRTVTQGIKQLDTEKANTLQSIAQWYASAQNQIRATKGQNVVALGQQALSNAIQAVQQAQADFAAKQNSLMQWAENNATTINQLKSNLQEVASYSPTLPTAGAINGLNGTVSSGGGYYPGTTDKLLK